MDYRYHVDMVCDYGNHETTHTFKVNTFDEAFYLFTEKVETCRVDKSVSVWSVSIYDMDAISLRLCLTDSDFE